MILRVENNHEFRAAGSVALMTKRMNDIVHRIKEEYIAADKNHTVGR
jgi:hypothetical protein